MRIVSLAVLTGTALAIVSPAAAQNSAEDWGGFYVGGHAGYSFLKEDGERVVFDTNLDGAYGDTVRNTGGADVFSPGFCDGANLANNAAGGCKDDEGSGESGVRAGYDVALNGFVLGVVGEATRLSVSDTVTAFTTTPAAYQYRRSVDTIYALRARAGMPFGPYLAYATGGVAFADIDRTFVSTNTVNSFTPRGGDDGMGWQLGLGGERRIGGSGFTLGAEYLFTSLEDEGHVVRFGRGAAAATHPFVLVNANGTDTRRTDDRIELHSLRVTATYRFTM